MRRLSAEMIALVPGIAVDPNERVALLQKGGIIRLRDYFGPGSLPPLRFGLAWDVTDGKEIDLDASAILLDQNLRLLDQVWFRQLASKDGSIQHMGDEREGDEIGDDEKINFNLAAVNPRVAYIGICINSYTGEELDDVASCACHLFEPHSEKEIAKYSLTNTKVLDGKTALLVSMLYRDGGTGEWCMHVISEPAMGRTVNDNVDELQDFIKRHPPLPRGPGRGISAAVGGMMSKTADGVLQLVVTVPPGMVPGQRLVVNGGAKGPIWAMIPVGAAPGSTFAITV